MPMHAKVMTWDNSIPRQVLVCNCSYEQSWGGLGPVAFWQPRERACMGASSQQAQQKTRRTSGTVPCGHRAWSLAAVLPTPSCKDLRLRARAAPKHNPQNVPDPEVEHSPCLAPPAAHSVPSLQCSSGREIVQQTVTTRRCRVVFSYEESLVESVCSLVLLEVLTQRHGLAVGDARPEPQP